MKYLNYFESKKDEYYVKYKFDEETEEVNLSDQSLKYILDLFPGIIESDSFNTGDFTYRYILLKPYTQEELDSYKDDDYINSANPRFIKIFKRGENTIGEFILSITELEDEYFIVYCGGEYKCDQIDGVKELLLYLKLLPK